MIGLAVGWKEALWLDTHGSVTTIEAAHRAMALHHFDRNSSLNVAAAAFCADSAGHNVGHLAMAAKHAPLHGANPRQRANSRIGAPCVLLMGAGGHRGRSMPCLRRRRKCATLQEGCDEAPSLDDGDQPGFLLLSIPCCPQKPHLELCEITARDRSQDRLLQDTAAPPGLQAQDGERMLTSSEKQVPDDSDPSSIECRYLMDLRVVVHPELKIERPGGRKLSICYFSEGEFEGPQLKGILLQGGGDWAEYESDRLLRINVKAVLQTDDDALIYIQYRGIWSTPPGVLQDVLSAGGETRFHASENYLRSIATFETSAARYAWLNEVFAIGRGRRTPGGATYRFYELL